MEHASCDFKTLAPQTAVPLEWATNLRSIAGTDSDAASEGVPLDQACLHQLVYAQARRTPSALAVVCGERRVSYQLLVASARRLARRLRDFGVAPGDRVGLCFDRSPELVIGMLAAMEVGAAYVPFDPDHPADRVRHSLEDATPVVVLAQRKWAERFSPSATSAAVGAAEQHATRALPSESDGARPHWSTTVIGYELDASLPVASFDDSPPVAEVDPASAAYIIYTSGSTGRPKGVVISHRAAVNTVLDINERFGVAAHDRVLALSSPCFDLSVYDVFGLLAAGGAVIMPNANRLRDPAHWAELARREQVTLWNTVPALLEMLVAHVEWQASQDLASLRCVLLSGDWINVALPDRVRALAPATRVISLGGATECAIWSVYYPIEEVPADWKRIPYGRALREQTIYVLDEELRQAEVGVLGEIHIGGMGVAEGYWNRPELTSERFVADPYDARLGARLYRTGDLGFYREDGDVELVGRMDTQVKIRGHRIELGEIEAALSQSPAVAQAVVIARRLATGAQALWAFIVPHSGAACRDDELVEQLRAALPNYMIPSQFVRLEKLPLNVNGKVDRQALACGEYSDQPRQPYLAPRNIVEQTLQGIWQTVLGVDSIGVRDDFFDLGGDSLLAVMVLTRAAEALGMSLTAGVLLERPTIEQLAELATKNDQPQASRASLILQTGSSGSPLFCVPCAYGSLWEFRKLAGRLPTDLRVYGLLPPGLDGQAEPLSRMDELVERYLAEIRAVQPVGPYFLAGFSFGGAAAYEIAQRLRAAGEEVRFLALLDAPARGRGRLVRSIQKIVETLRHARAALRRSAAIEQTQVGAQATRPHSASEDAASLPNRLRVHDASRRALDAYQPRPYPGSLILFRAAIAPSWPKRLLGDSTLLWRRLAQGAVTERLVPANHFDFFADGPINVLADQFCECMEAATVR